MSAVISMAHSIQNVGVSRRIFLKYQVNRNTACGAIKDLPWQNIWCADNPVEVLTEHLLLPVGRLFICVRNKDKPRFDNQCRHDLATKGSFFVYP